MKLKSIKDHYYASEKRLMGTVYEAQHSLHALLLIHSENAILFEEDEEIQHIENKAEEDNKISVTVTKKNRGRPTKKR